MRHEVARPVHAAAVMAAAGDEEQRPLGLIRRLREVPRQRDQHRQAVAVVAGRIEPAVGVRVDDDDLVRSVGRRRADRVVALAGPSAFRCRA